MKRSGAVVPFNEERIANAIYRAAVAVGGRDRKIAKRLASQVVDLLNQTTETGYVPHIEEIQDAVEKVLIENGHATVAKAFILYRDEAARRRQVNARHAASPSENIPWAKIWRVLDWAVDHGVHTLNGLNARIAHGEFAQIVHESEAAYEDDVAGAAQLLLNRQEKIRLVLVCGPSSSGKTTTTIKLEKYLLNANLRFKVLNVDHYFHNLDVHPKDEFGDYDYETPQALDLPLINQHLIALLEGQQVMIPHYDFKTGTRRLDQSPLRLADNELLLIDSLHGLFPPMTAGIEAASKFKLYLEPLLQMKGPNGRYMRWTDLRLMRRMLRDAVHRAWNPQQTLEHWHYVRASEMRNIIPYQSSADFVINTAMPYELCLYRPRLLKDFSTWIDKYRDNPLRQDAYQRSSRIWPILKQVHGITDDSPVPSTSVLREFIGGSSLSYGV
ncbi:MAG: ATP cone domain-containing protein [Candidatus Promineifilaceae bacterium]|nr:ATP cone domain-containing protein [Candidatus Promineifilaceae bacterium]